MNRAPATPFENRVLENPTGGPGPAAVDARMPVPQGPAAAPPSREQRCAGIRPEVLGRVLELIDRRFNEPLRVEDLGRHACLSPFHFARMFKVSVGLAPHAYLTAKRMEHARHLLADTTVPIAEVARQVGFRTQAHFSGVFRRQVGSTPGQYRRQHRGAAPAAAEGAR